ncbi:helix-turn-helix transcriptional regulator [Bordetella genomosp. 11]|nr:LuxR C-terminal-related transcriptional regulator [Bordetella genomosp. 11]
MVIPISFAHELEKKMAAYRTAFRRALEAVDHLTDPAPPWSDILQTARDLAGADSATLIIFDSKNTLLNFSAVGFEEQCFADYESHFHSCDILEQGSRHAPAGTWLDTAQMYTSAQLRRSEFHTDFMTKHRMGQIVSLVLESGPSVRAALGFQRGTVDDKAGDHLNSGNLAAYFRVLRSQMARRHAAVEMRFQSIEDAFSSADQAIFLLGDDASLIRGSPLAERYLEAMKGWRIRGGKLQHADRDIQARFEAQCRAVTADGRARLHATTSGWGDVILLDIAAASPGLSLLGNRMLLVRMRRKSAFATPDAERLASVFDITRGEAAVLAGLAAGHSVDEIAVLRRTAVLTVRKQVASLMKKMECNRQSELVRLACLLQE